MYIGRNPNVKWLNLEPQSSDPSNPNEGDLHYSDGTARSEGLWIYKNGALEQVSAQSTVSVKSKTSNYTALSTDEVILCSSSAFTVTLPTAVGLTGKRYVIKKTDSSFSNIITIDGDGSETIDGSTTTTLNTIGETLHIISDGSNWQIENRVIPSNEVDGGAITITATTTAPTKGTISTDKFVYWREGSHLAGRICYRQTAGGTNGVGDYLFQIVPAGLTVDTSKITVNTAVEGASAWVVDNAIGHWDGSTGASSNTGVVSLYDSTKARLLGFNSGGSDFGVSSASSTYNLGATNMMYVFNFKVPISGWNG